MRVSLSFSVDTVTDAGLLKWMDAQSNRSETVRQALYRFMQSVPVPPDSVSELLASTRRLEAGLASIKDAIVRAGERNTISVTGPPSTQELLEMIPSEALLRTGRQIVDAVTEVASDASDASAPLANLRRLRRSKPTHPAESKAESGTV